MAPALPLLATLTLISQCTSCRYGGRIIPRVVAQASSGKEREAGDKMSHWISGDAIAHGTKLHYYRTGGDKPPLVLAHGITDDGLCWTPVAEALSGDYDVIMVDARGHGKSEAPEGGYTLRNLAVELAGLIEVLALKKPFILGHSMGAITTLVLAGLYPDLPRAILLEDPPAFWCYDGSTPRNIEMRSGLTQWIQANKRKTRDDLLAEGRANAGWSEAELEPWVNAKHRFSLKVTELIHPTDIVSINFPELLQHITCPAIFISADPQRGAAANPEEIDKLKAWLPKLQVTHIPEAGHNIRRDQFARYLNVVKQALVNL
jgi:N-formylmaleamate deformylase